MAYSQKIHTFNLVSHSKKLNEKTRYVSSNFQILYWKAEKSVFVHSSEDRTVMDFLLWWVKIIQILKKKRFKKIAFTFSEKSNYWQKSFLGVIRQNIAGWCQPPFCFQTFVDNAQQCSAFTPEANFPAHSLNIHWRW